MNKFVSPTTGAAISSAQFGILLVLLFMPKSTLWGRSLFAFAFAIKKNNPAGSKKQQRRTRKQWGQLWEHRHSSRPWQWNFLWNDCWPESGIHLCDGSWFRHQCLRNSAGAGDHGKWVNYEDRRLPDRQPGYFGKSGYLVSCGGWYYFSGHHVKRLGVCAGCKVINDKDYQ